MTAPHVHSHAPMPPASHLLLTKTTGNGRTKHTTTTHRPVPVAAAGCRRMLSFRAALKTGRAERSWKVGSRPGVLPATCSSPASCSSCAMERCTSGWRVMSYRAHLGRCWTLCARLCEDSDWSQVNGGPGAVPSQQQQQQYDKTRCMSVVAGSVMQ